MPRIPHIPRASVDTIVIKEVLQLRGAGQGVVIVGIVGDDDLVEVDVDGSAAAGQHALEDETRREVLAPPLVVAGDEPVIIIIIIILGMMKNEFKNNKLYYRDIYFSHY
jgi:hypothetical protein